jgi:hypothetical protein
MSMMDFPIELVMTDDRAESKRAVRAWLMHNDPEILGFDEFLADYMAESYIVKLWRGSKRCRED